MITTEEPNLQQNSFGKNAFNHHAYCSDAFLYDGSGKRICIKGVNIGNWLVPEGWMGVIDIDGQNDESDGEKLTYLKLKDALKKNEHAFTDSQIEELLNIYYEKWFTEEDVKRIKENGFNCVRLPFLHFNIADENAEIKPNGFKWIDKCLSWCEKNSLYCILDLHGTYGSQNKEHHSGDDTKCILFDDKESQDKTVKLWQQIADRYKDNTYVLGYDLLNEPKGNTNRTIKVQHEFHNVLYNAVREIDSKHIIFIESCWDFSDFPNISEYGWTNVVFEMHMYDFSTDTKGYLDYHMSVYDKETQLRHISMLIGEFWMGMADLPLVMDTFDNYGFHWTFWTFKTNRRDDWGAYKLDIDRVNVSHASFDEIKRTFTDTVTKPSSISNGFSNLLKLM